MPRTLIDFADLSPLHTNHSTFTSEAQARQIKALNPETHVWHYRNMQLRLPSRNEFDCPKYHDERYADYFLHNLDGSFLNTTAQFLPTWMGCDTVFPDAKYPTETTQFYLDWRNESARNWWLDVHLGSIINSTVVDGFYWDDPVFGNEGTFIRDGFTPAELADIDNHMQATRLEGYERLSRGGGFCTGSTCYTSVPTVADCTSGCDRRGSNCTCDLSPEVIIRNVQAARYRSDDAVLMQLPPPYDFHDPDGGAYDVGCGGPAVVQSTHSNPKGTFRYAHSVQLSCLPGTGSMTIDFASFGLPAIGRGGASRGTGIMTANCNNFAVNATCDAGPAVLQQLKVMCDGKQSCRFNTSHPVFARPASSVGACASLPLSDLLLAVRATGCKFGTGSGVIFNFREQLAMFLLTRGEHWWMGTGWIANYAPATLPEYFVDYGTPIGNLTITPGGVLSRQWSKMNITLDANTFEATFDPPSAQGAAAAAAVVETSSSCDLAGTWVTGYAPNYAGGAEPATPPPSHSRLEVIAAVTPFGTPPAQYVTDAFGVRTAFALHPNWQTCLGNGTCSPDQFGNARALNADAPPCSFIEWLAPAPQGKGSWCKAPFCTPPAPTPAPPPPVVFPKFNVTWEPTWIMSRSTISNPSGNLTGLDTGALLAADARYGIIAFDGGHDDPDPSRLGPPGDVCRYAKTLDTSEAQARAIKAISPDTHVWTYVAGTLFIICHRLSLSLSLTHTHTHSISLLIKDIGTCSSA